ncbi:MAG: glucose-1-phosphate thymidylyltransferase RfbA [Erysipelotrichaceae bacterium]|nr:glucose-1-phosphate thymidylyltransferase RfbA [Erysipelotrichaceae bacterium]
MKGIILAGGSGTRLYPLTKVTSKQLLPVYDKPMIYYPLSTLMLAKIREILIISTPQDLPNFERLLGDGSQFGVSFSYKVQEVPNGLAQAFVLGEEFIGDDDVCLILGDNIFYGNNFGTMLKNAVNVTESSKRAVIFGKYVNDPERFGVAEFDENGQVISLEEKPEHPKSNYAVVGLYFYDNRVVEYAKQLKPSKRGEYEITDLNKIYLENGELDIQVFGRGFAWLDTGTIESLAEASDYVKLVEDVQGIRISVPEEIAFYNQWINEEQILKAAEAYGKSPYGDHLRNIVKGNVKTTYNKKGK